MGVCGGIAAYKAAYLIRNLVKAGAEVRVVMTDSAKSFIGPLTLSTLTKHKVYTSLQNHETGEWENHVELALWADFMLIAPATSNTIAKMANGICDNLLLATYFSSKSPVFISPAMDLDMAEHPSLMRNFDLLKADGVKIIPYEKGELASGLIGLGRMAEPDHIVEFLIKNLSKNQDLIGKKILVNAGPTHEPIDPVRFIGNRSTGKMGLAIANELALRGAEVELVLGPTSHTFDFEQNIHLTQIETAIEMFEACTKAYTHCNGAILTAAIADFTPENKSDIKIKKTANNLQLSLVKTPDTLNELGKMKKENQFLVGFALETNNEIEYAQNKLKKKNLDFIVLNSLKNEGAGFAKDTNIITIIHKSGEICNFDLKSKKEVAKDIVNELARTCI